MHRAFAIAVSIVLSMSAAQAASPLSSEQVTHFVETLAPIQTFGDALEKEGKLNVLIGGGASANGEFKPYSTGVDALKKQFPADFRRLAGVVKPHGFTPEEWGETGDRVMAAYMALRIERDEPGALDRIEPVDLEELKKMPPELQIQMRDYMAMMEAVKKAPSADRTAVLPSMELIDAHIAAQEEAGGK